MRRAAPSRSRPQGFAAGARASRRPWAEAGEHVRGEHEEQWTDGDQEHDGDHADRLGEEIAVAVERPGEIEAEHSRPAVRAERLGSNERGEECERAPDEEHVVAVRDQVVGVEAVDDRGDGDRDEGGQERDHERDRGQDLVPGAAPQPEHALHREHGQRENRPGGTLAGAVVAAVAEVEELCVLSRHVPAPR